MSLYQKNIIFKQNSSLHNKIHDIIKYLKKEREKNLKFPQEWRKDGSILRLSPAIHLDASDRHFEHEYIIKLSKKDLLLYQLNLMLNSNQGLPLFRQTQTLSRQKQGSQQGFLYTMFPFPTLTELTFMSCWCLIHND